MAAMPTTAQKCLALVKGRCPRCTQGPIYATSSVMNEECAVCSLRFHREPGYFLGALYLSYGMATGILLVFFGTLHLLLPAWDLGVLVLVAAVLFLPFASAVTRYARIVWIYFDRWAWPARPGRSD